MEPFWFLAAIVVTLPQMAQSAAVAAPPRPVQRLLPA